MIRKKLVIFRVSEQPTFRNPPIHPNLNIVQILKIRLYFWTLPNSPLLELFNPQVSKLGIHNISQVLRFSYEVASGCSYSSSTLENSSHHYGKCTQFIKYLRYKWECLEKCCSCRQLTDPSPFVVYGTGHYFNTRGGGGGRGTLHVSYGH